MDFPEILTIIFALAGATLFYKYIKSKKLPPGPWGLPIVGFLPWIDPKRPHITLTELSRKYGPIYSITMGYVFTVVISNPELAKKVLASEIFTARANLYVTHGIMGGNGLIASEGEKWKEQRRFVSSFLKGLGMVKVGAKRAVMEERILIGLRQTLQMINERENKEIDPLNIFMHCLGNVINSMVFGKTWEYEDEQWKWLRSLLIEGVKLIGVAGPVNFLPYLRWWPGYGSSLRYLQEGKEETHKVYKQIAEEDRPGAGEDLLTAYKKMMDNGQGTYFDEKQMYHVLADMFGAGLDTSLTTLRWFLLLMAAYPDIQGKVQDELESVLKERDEPTLEDMPYLPYLVACIQETQRLKSIVPLGIPHGTWDDTNLNGFEIPRGTMILILQWAIHMDSNVWTSPNEFIPERFIDHEGKLIKKHENFIPFQSGKRVCIGEEMAKMMLFLFAAGILWKYNVTVAEDGERLGEALEGICGLILGPGEHRLMFSQRNKEKLTSKTPIFKEHKSNGILSYFQLF